jgi:hypothetical protein
LSSRSWGSIPSLLSGFITIVGGVHINVGDDLRANPFQEEGNDGDQGTTSKDLVQVPIGPVTRARAKKFKDVLNGLIQELWAQANSWRPIEHDPRGQQRIVTLIQVLQGSGQG